MWQQAGVHVTEASDGCPEWTMHVEDFDAQGLPIPLGMLTHHTMRGVVPLRTTGYKTTMRLHYHIAGLRPLAQAVQRISARQWEGFFVALAHTLQHGRDYLLHPHYFVLHPQWVWVRQDVREVVLPYVPLRSFPLKISPWMQWNCLYEWCVQHRCPPAVLQWIAPHQWHEQTFCHEVWIEKIRTAPLHQSSPSVLQAQATSLPTGAGRSERSSLLLLHDLRETQRSIPKDAIPEVSDEAPSFGRWKQWWKQLWRAETRQKLPKDVSLPTAHSAPPLQDTPLTSHQIVSALAGRTVLLSSPDQTVKLSPQGVPTHPKVLLHVEQEEGGGPTTIAVHAFPFHIGRDDTTAHLVLAHPGISRTHIALTWVHPQLFVTDCHSRNGTLLHAQALRPDVPTPLHDWDVLCLPGGVKITCDIQRFVQ